MSAATCHICGEQVPTLADVLDHLRLFHPDQYDDSEVAIVDMAGEMASDPEGIEVARITIVRRLTDDDTVDFVDALDGSGNELSLTEALGMMRLAEDTLIRQRMGDAG